MNDPEFDKLLSQLHQEIEHTHSLDNKERVLLRDISKDIRDLLDRGDNKEEKPNTLTIDRLNELIELMEMSHPTLTNLMNKLLTILSNAGI